MLHHSSVVLWIEVRDKNRYIDDTITKDFEVEYLKFSCLILFFEPTVIGYKRFRSL